jgi:SsrA-binding protein
MPRQSPAEDRPRIQIICRNKRASREYEILDTLECGLVLTGSEVKSLREGRASIDEAYARLKDGEVWLLGCDIPEYSLAHQWNHKPKRPRKLLLHKRQIGKFAGKATQRGYTLIPLQLYFKNGLVKVELAVARGKPLRDRRQELKEAEAQREIRRAMSRRPHS